jgi:hypothetical protein
MARVQAADRVKAAFEALNQTAGLRSVATSLDRELSARVLQGEKALRETFPDIQIKLEKVLEKSGRVGFRYTCSGTHKRLRKKATWSGSGVATVVNGKITGFHVVEDHLGRELDLGNVPASPEDDASGDWKGQVFGVDFTLDLTQQPPNKAVKGTLSVLGMSFAVAGTNVPPNVKLSGKANGGTITFVGTWKGANEIDGVLNGGGIDNQKATITRG